MDTVIMNFINCKTSDPHRLLLNLTDKINLKKVINMLPYQILAWTNIKMSYMSNKFKISGPTWNEEFEFQIFKIVLNIY